jgi:hypothetical protein
VDELPEAVEDLPACRIRPACRWWLQEGKAACLRCPLIVTETANPTEQLRHAADPAAWRRWEAGAGSAQHDEIKRRSDRKE